MRLVAFSDLHGYDLNTIDPTGADFCIIAGDIAPLKGFSRWDLEKQERWMLFVFEEWCSRFTETEFVFIAGNHDFWVRRISATDYRWPKNAHYLCNSGCQVKGVKFWGSPLVPTINGRWAFEASPATLNNYYREIDPETDILITHTPPRVEGSDIDRSLEDRYGRSCHFGSPELTEAIECVQPKFLFCGHIHTGDHACTEIGATKCFNVSVLDENYDLHYTPFDGEI